MPILLYFIRPKRSSGNCYVICFPNDKTALLSPLKKWWRNLWKALFTVMHVGVFHLKKGAWQQIFHRPHTQPTHKLTQCGQKIFEIENNVSNISFFSFVFEQKYDKLKKKKLWNPKFMKNEIWLYKNFNHIVAEWTHSSWL